MKYLLPLFFTFKLLALEPFVPAKERRNYERIHELIETKPIEALELIVTMKETYSPVFDYIAGGIYLDQGKINDAEQVFLKAINKEAKFTRAHKALALLYLEQDKLDPALKHLSLTLAQGGGDAAIWKNLAFIHMKKENWQAAWFAFENVRLFEPESTNLDKYFLDIRMHQHDFSDALSISQEILKREPENKNVWMTMINCFIVFCFKI